MSWHDIPELIEMDARHGLVRIPPELDVPVTPRVRRLIDTAPFRRLSKISQLGLVSLVYPAAHHTRFEHSLGVYRLALLYLRRLTHDPRCRELLTPGDAELFVVAALLHDIGHWPFCHPIEDMHLPEVPPHEQFAERYLQDSEIAELLRDDWGIQPEHVCGLLSGKGHQGVRRLLASMLSGPIDIDKMDYLARDSLHAGVPYGRNFDSGRLIGSLCLNAAGDGLAISEKGKTAAEMMVFARYVMFSEVYWHHGVRAATAMLQRAFYLLRDVLDFQTLFELTEPAFIEAFRQTAVSRPFACLLDGLFGPRRRLYKRWAQFSIFEGENVYRRLAGRPYPWLVQCSEALAQELSRNGQREVLPHEVIFDAPPVQREIEFAVEVYFAKEQRYRSLTDISPVVQTLARRQFDDYVKRVRVFLEPEILKSVQSNADPETLVHRAIDAVEVE